MIPKPKYKKRKPDPVQKIQLQDKKECWVTGQTTGLHKHHIYGGARRKLSEKYGLYVYLTPYWHNASNDGVHFDYEFDMKLKTLAQTEFEKVYSRDKFMELFGRNYLE